MKNVALHRANSSSQMISFYRFAPLIIHFLLNPSDPLTQNLNPFTCEVPKGLAETREQYGKGFPFRQDTPVKGLRFWVSGSEGLSRKCMINGAKR